MKCHQEMCNVLHASQVCPLNGDEVQCAQLFDWMDIFLVSSQDVSIRVN